MIISCITQSTASAFDRPGPPGSRSGGLGLVGSIVEVMVVSLSAEQDKYDLNR
jgi:hypothetical protein